jgi:hypothetical protein
MTGHRLALPIGVFLVLLAVAADTGLGQSVDLRGQASVLARITGDPVLTVRSDLRYIPSLFGTMSVGEERTLDAELAFDLFASGTVERDQRPVTEGSIDPYRVWLRYATPRFEARAGLQKISFGSATLFRPLMWFDAIDPRDPLQITRGVYAALGKFSVGSTAGLWFWGIYGQNEVKGWEIFPSREGSAEYGGRAQFPLLSGETGLSYHHRTAEVTLRLPTYAGNDPQTFDFPEDRVGLDGKWDVGPGIWFEATLTHQHADVIEYPWQHALTLGADYTISAGNGLTMLGEYFLQKYTTTALGSGPPASIAAVSFSYPVTILDEAFAILYLDTQQWDIYAYLTWRRTYDDWVIHLTLFANPSQPLLIAPAREGISLPGNGAMVTVVFNH